MKTKRVILGLALLAGIVMARMLWWPQETSATVLVVQSGDSAHAKNVLQRLANGAVVSFEREEISHGRSSSASDASDEIVVLGKLISKKRNKEIARLKEEILRMEKRIQQSENPGSSLARFLEYMRANLELHKTMAMLQIAIADNVLMTVGAQLRYPDPAAGFTIISVGPFVVNVDAESGSPISDMAEWRRSCQLKGKSAQVTRIDNVVANYPIEEKLFPSIGYYRDEVHRLEHSLSLADAYEFNSQANERRAAIAKEWADANKELAEINHKIQVSISENNIRMAEELMQRRDAITSRMMEIVSPRITVRDDQSLAVPK